MSVQICKTLTNTFGLDFVKKTYGGWPWWHTPGILAIQEAEARELHFKTSLGYKAMPSLNKANQIKLQDCCSAG